jgi:hypothetical protein
MNDRRSRDKGVRTGRVTVRLLQAQGIAAPKISGMYEPVAERTMSVLGSDTTIEVKRRATGFAQIYDWLNERDVIVKADRREQVARTATEAVMLSPGSATLVYRRQDKMAPAHYARGGGP